MGLPKGVFEVEAGYAPARMTRALHRRESIRPPWALVGAASLLLLSSAAHATPGQAIRLSGAEAQGPATRSLSAIYHNPAMLGSIPGFSFQANVRSGVDHRVIRRSGVDELGIPNGELGSREQYLDPQASFFVGGAFSFDPVAIGFGVYDLGNRYRFSTSESQRYHLSQANGIPARNVDLHHEFTLAIAWNALRELRLGAAVHFPLLHRQISREDDTFLSGDARGAGEVGCSGVDGATAEDPNCGEYLGVRATSSRFNLSATFGLAAEVNDEVTLAIRFRTAPWLNQSRLDLAGRAWVCVPDDAADADAYPTSLARCSEAEAGDAALSFTQPTELAVGTAARWGQRRQWHVDTNLYWQHNCPVAGDCGFRQSSKLSLIGLPQDTAILPDTQVYRGNTDIFGVEVWGRYDFARGSMRARARELIIPAAAPDSATEVDAGAGATVGNEDADDAPAEGPRARESRYALLFGANFSSPTVEPGARTIVESQGWLVGGTIGARIRLRNRRNGRRGGWYLSPGYSLDIGIPSRVGGRGATPEYDPGAALDFSASGGDISGPGANAVLSGRARPTNAGGYQQYVHTLSFGVGWSELPL